MIKSFVFNIVIMVLLISLCGCGLNLGREEEPSAAAPSMATEQAGNETTKVNTNSKVEPSGSMVQEDSGYYYLEYDKLYHFDEVKNQSEFVTTIEHNDVDNKYYNFVVADGYVYYSSVIEGDYLYNEDKLKCAIMRKNLLTGETEKLSDKIGYFFSIYNSTLYFYDDSLHSLDLKSGGEKEYTNLNRDILGGNFRAYVFNSKMFIECGWLYSISSDYTTCQKISEYSILGKPYSYNGDLILMLLKDDASVELSKYNIENGIIQTLADIKTEVYTEEPDFSQDVGFAVDENKAYYSSKDGTFCVDLNDGKSTKLFDKSYPYLCYAKGDYLIVREPKTPDYDVELQNHNYTVKSISILTGNEKILN